MKTLASAVRGRATPCLAWPRARWVAHSRPQRQCSAHSSVRIKLLGSDGITRVGRRTRVGQATAAASGRRRPQAVAARPPHGRRLGGAAVACPTLVRRPTLVPSLPITPASLSRLPLLTPGPALAPSGRRGRGTWRPVAPAAARPLPPARAARGRAARSRATLAPACDPGGLRPHP